MSTIIKPIYKQFGLWGYPLTTLTVEWGQRNDHFTKHCVKQSTKGGGEGGRTIQKYFHVVYGYGWMTIVYAELDNRYKIYL